MQEDERTLDELRVQFSTLRTAAETEYLRRKDARDRAALLRNAIAVAAGLISFAFVGWAYRRVRRDMAAIEGQRHDLEVSETNLRLFENVLHATANAVVITNPKGIIEWVNPAFTHLTGYSADEVIGKNPHILSSGRQRPEFFTELWQTIHARRVWKGQLINRRKDDRLYHEEMTITPVCANPECDRITHFIAIKEEITSRVEAEEILRRQARLIDLSPDGILTRRLDGTILFWSKGAEALYGWTAEEAIGQRTHDLLQTQFPQPLAQILEQLQREGRWTGELTQTAKSGRKVSVQSHWIGEFDERGQVIELMESNVDVTERKRFEAELARSNHDLEQFGYIVSHDLQEPLRMVSSYVKLLEQRYQDQLDPSAHDFIRFAIDGAERMSQLIKDVLQLSRIGAQGKEPESVALTEVLARARENLQVAIAESSAEISAGPLPTVRGDPNQLVQLFQNLIGNALKFRAPERPAAVRVGAERNNGHWRISVADQGIGIAPEHTERIFQPFKRLHTRKEYPGSGIGLAVCKKIVERHGGRIWVESQPGKGSTFYVTLKPA